MNKNDLISLGFKQETNIDYIFFKIIDKGDKNWMKFTVQLNYPKSILYVYFDDNTNQHPINNIHELNKWIEIYTKI